MDSTLCPLKHTGASALAVALVGAGRWADDDPVTHVELLASCDREKCAWWVKGYGEPDQCAMRYLFFLAFLQRLPWVPPAGSD